ncbi:hypothetical protein [Enhygromyxa salina]|uniref:Uncharacterized protein n=1 Tax=Enhygromyxa salina TaxID=215803 RepID=A0A2S9YSU0_9BACT|nr:hypothetical protein [Enhygromyxa salina]PRQ08185.1 hypothetical protein ENSA7_21570 [Enhygromyxa salina]
MSPPTGSCASRSTSRVTLACGPKQPGGSSSDGPNADGDTSNGDGDGDGDPGDGDGDLEGDGDTGDTSADEAGIADVWGGSCDSLGYMMAACNNEFLVCIDDWSCNFYDTTDMYGVSPVGNCSPVCETDADCDFGPGSEACFDPNIVCASFGQDAVRRCILPCQTDADCYSSQFCAENLDICVSHTT